MAMDLLLTTDEEAKLSNLLIACSAIHRQCKKEWDNGVSSDLNNFEVKIKSHEKTEAHLDAIIAFERWKTL